MSDHPITPPPELRRLWAQQAQRMDPHDPVAWMQHVSTQSARWGADRELEAIRQLIEINGCPSKFIDFILDARRPEPPSLKKQACDALDTYVYGNPNSQDKERTYNTIRRALERLAELEGLQDA